MHAGMYVSMCLRIYVSIRTLHVSVCVYVCVHVWLSVRMCVSVTCAEAGVNVTDLEMPTHGFA